MFARDANKPAKKGDRKESPIHKPDEVVFVIVTK
jgi:hypothetical protein